MLLVFLLVCLLLKCKAAEKCIDTYFQSFTAAAKKDNISQLHFSLPYTKPLATLPCIERLNWDYSPQQMEILRC